MSLWSVFRGNKHDAKKVGEFLTHAVDHIRNGGNFATCETALADGTRIKLSLERTVPENGWECVCGLVVKKRYQCLCGGREHNSTAIDGGTVDG